MTRQYLYRVDVQQDDGSWSAVRHYMSPGAAMDRTLRLHDRGLVCRVVRSDPITWSAVTP